MDSIASTSAAAISRGSTTQCAIRGSGENSLCRTGRRNRSFLRYGILLA